ncbi:molybdenum cofactor guanylyltransferase [Pelagibacterium limicola]|uniref:molybdenum cofactor guanylyltransferase n=1 Tax=Pelagibacterium limicola TaxID=2791022 RepID=UPI0018AF78D0|nr:NTP transferase domain-containing protein [Pelagibacterium limicola]
MISGLILDGGSGRRFGGIRKGDLRLGNVTFLQRAIARLAPQVDAVLHSIPEGKESAAVYSGLVLLPDLPDGVTGPAAGLWAGALWCAARDSDALMVSVSVDTPCFPEDFCSRALALLGPDIGCVVAAYGGRDYPTNALWRVPALLDALKAETRAARGPRLRDIAARIGVTVCSYDERRQNPFAGINTLADLLALSRAVQKDDETALNGVGNRKQIG